MKAANEISSKQNILTMLRTHSNSANGDRKTIVTNLLKQLSILYQNFISLPLSVQAELIGLISSTLIPSVVARRTYLPQHRYSFNNSDNTTNYFMKKNPMTNGVVAGIHDICNGSVPIDADLIPSDYSQVYSMCGNDIFVHVVNNSQNLFNSSIFEECMRELLDAGCGDPTPYYIFFAIILASLTIGTGVVCWQKMRAECNEKSKHTNLHNSGEKLLEQEAQQLELQHGTNDDQKSIIPKRSQEHFSRKLNLQEDSTPSNIQTIVRQTRNAYRKN
jgi:hypothetical protein